LRRPGRILQTALLAVCVATEPALPLGRDERHYLAFLQGPGERARTAFLHAKEARSALVVARVVRREDRLRLVRHHAAQGREETCLDEDLEAVAYAEDRLARLHESDEVVR